MTEGSPRPGDNDTHDETTAPTPNTDAAPDRGTSATAPDTPGHARPSSAGAGEAGSLPEPAIEQSSEGGDGSDDDDDEEEEDDDDGDDGDDDDDDADEDEEDEEPKLKYARLTPHLGSVYRNGDATSAFLVAGDKMVRTPTALPVRTIVAANSVRRSSGLTMETSSVALSFLRRISC